jgi:hypothetical protein
MMERTDVLRRLPKHEEVRIKAHSIKPLRRYCIQNELLIR